MSHVFKTAALAMVVALGTSSAFAADTGTITINGNVTSVTCEASVNGVAGGDGTITLPTVSTSELATAGNSVGDTAFTIDLANCDSGVTAVTAYFQSGAGVDATTGYLKNTASDNGVGVKLMDSVGSLIKAGSSDQAQAETTLTSGAGSLSYQAAYVALEDTVSSGTVTSSVAYTLDYN